jgi:hypothetical protein
MSQPELKLYFNQNEKKGKEILFFGVIRVGYTMDAVPDCEFVCIEIDEIAQRFVGKF